VKLALGFNPILPLKAAAIVAARAEASGYDFVWMHESLFQRDVVTCISAMAASTNRIRIGSGAMNTFTRHPVTAATTFATLSELSEGRVMLGLELGSFPTVPLIGHKIFPVGRTKPLKRIKEYVEVVRAVWKGGTVEYEGEFFKVHDLTLGFELKSSVPVFVASLSPKTLAFAIREADGAMISPGLSTVRGTERMAASVKAGETAGGRKVEKVSYLLTSPTPPGRLVSTLGGCRRRSDTRYHSEPTMGRYNVHRRSGMGTDVPLHKGPGGGLHEPSCLGFHDLPSVTTGLTPKFTNTVCLQQ
jgi:alkanesulfonate monooxygenase SsuD/methylene tetrahydromethanopterin reductase-like flavin-dependent oxidoreductase (luciferase family)